MKRLLFLLLTTLSGLSSAGTAESAPRPKRHIAAFVWPSCHRDSVAERYLWPECQGEWEVIRRGDARFEGHDQPKRPLWGYEMDDDPQVVERWIRTALKYGIDTFVYDWYWYQGGPFLESALDNGFLGAPSCEKMNFYVMWANHDVKYNYWNWHRWGDNEDILFSADFSAEDYPKIVDHMISRYFSRRNYLQIDGCPVLAIYSLKNFVRSFSSVEEARKALDYFRTEAVKAGFKGIHLQEVSGEGKALNAEQFAQRIERAQALGIHSEAFYNMGGFHPDYQQHCSRAEMIRAMWHRQWDLPVMPCVSIGWDDTPRFPKKGAQDVSRWNRTPENFGVALENAIDYLDRYPEVPQIVYINAWNEWVEGSYLLPDETHGFAWLEEVRSTLRRTRKPRISRYATDLKVISYNIRLASGKDGEHQWKNRRPATSAMILAQRPDVMGIQEALAEQLAYLSRTCSDYGYVGGGREDGRHKGETTAIFWNRRTVSLVDWGMFWLSETPDKPSLGWDAAYLRTATWARMKLRANGHEFFVVNTHLDNRGATARMRGMELILNRIQTLNTEGLPVVLTGDFNTGVEDPMLSMLDRQMSNIRNTARESDSVLSFNAFGKQPARMLDHIYTQGFDRGDRFCTDTLTYAGRPYISDHYPIVAWLHY